MSIVKQKTRLFISYAHFDKPYQADLLRELKVHFSASGAFEFSIWTDEEILPGERWDDEIKAELAKCDVGLLLLSPAFLGSHYIRIEVKELIEREKKLIPVLLCHLDFEYHDLRGLDVHQIFYLENRQREKRAFSDCVAPRHKKRFAHELWLRLEKRLKK